MFNEDVNRIKVCLEHNDYYSAMEYAMLVKDNYKNEERKYFEKVIKYVKEGDYKNLKNKKP